MTLGAKHYAYVALFCKDVGGACVNLAGAMLLLAITIAPSYKFALAVQTVSQVLRTVFNLRFQCDM